MTGRRLGCVISFLTAFFVLISTNAWSQGTTPPDSELILEITNLFQSGRIRDAEYQALKALDERPDLPRMVQSDLNKILAFCALANDDEPTAIRRFEEAIRANPNLSPDALTWSPKIRRAFDQARVEYEKWLDQSRREQWAERAGIYKQASLRSLYLPGSGQIMKGQRLKGMALGAGFWLATAAFIYTQVALPEAKDNYHQASTPQTAFERWRDYRDVYRISIVSGLTAATIYTYAFADALWRSTREARAEKSE